jgi:glycosyltransferase involved in cell wall biosynthesis
VLSGVDHIEPLHTKPCFVIRNGVDPDHFFPQSHEASRAELGLTSPGPYVGFVGGFFPWHGLDTLIEAMAIVVKSFPTVQCILVGDGQTRTSLEKFVQELQLSDHVYFSGRADFDMVPKWIAAADVCVVLHRQTRSYPGDSMKLWEYLACGRPVVATAGPGYGETVEELQCGLSAKAGDPIDLAQQLRCLLIDHDLRTTMGARGRAAVVRRHTWGARAAHLEQVCDQTVTGLKAAA